MTGNISTIFLFLFLPAAVMWLCKEVKFFGKIGPILILYLAGILIGNTIHPPAMAKIQDIISSAMVPIAIPLMLFGCSFRRIDGRSSLLALVTGLVAVVVSVVGGYLIFGRNIPEGYKTGAMLSGVYTGGTVNLAALKAMLDVSDETFLLVNSCDMLVCFVYLVFLMSFGIKLFRRFLPSETPCTTCPDYVQERRTRWNIKDAGVLIAIDCAIVCASAGLGMLFPDSWFMTVLILMLTTLGIAASFLPAVKSRPQAYDMGFYCICVFSLVVASMADLTKLDFSGSLNTLLYLTFVIFVSLLIQVLFARILRIDSDITVISSVSYICSPPFVPMLAMTMKNRNVIVPGLTIGVVGYVVGNYIGFLMAGLLQML